MFYDIYSKQNKLSIVYLMRKQFVDSEYTKENLNFFC